MISFNCAVLEAGPDILNLKIRKVFENFGLTHTGGKRIEYILPVICSAVGLTKNAKE